jgi:hypothetical protein
MAAAFSWNFTTRDDTPPTVIATSPVNGATGVGCELRAATRFLLTTHNSQLVTRKRAGL